MPPAAWRSLGAEIAAFLLAACCSGCDEPGTLLCDSCAGELTARPRARTSPAGLTIWTALDYAGVAARCIRRLKEEGETSLAGPLGAALRRAAEMAAREPDGREASPLDAVEPGAPADAAARGAGLVLVPVPTSRPAFRRRGYRVPEVLLRRSGLQAARLLVTARTPADQRRLGRRERAQNVRDSMRALRRGAGQRVLLVDDVVTTGATLDEAARVLRAAGFRVIAGAAVAATPRRSELPGDTSVRGRDIA